MADSSTIRFAYRAQMKAGGRRVSAEFINHVTNNGVFCQCHKVVDRAMRRVGARTRANFGQASETQGRERTGWRRELDLNCQYASWNFLTTAHRDGFYPCR